MSLFLAINLILEAILCIKLIASKITKNHNFKILLLTHSPSPSFRFHLARRARRGIRIVPVVDPRKVFTYSTNVQNNTKQGNNTTSLWYNNNVSCFLLLLFLEPEIKSETHSHASSEADNDLVHISQDETASNSEAPTPTPETVNEAVDLTFDKYAQGDESTTTIPVRYLLNFKLAKTIT